MKILWKNKFLFWNLIALIFIKAIFSYSELQFASLLNGVSIFSEEEVISQTNTLRQAAGLNGLKESSTLDIAATQKLQDMLQNQYFAHTSPTGTSPWHWFDTNKYKYSYAGENLAIGFLTAKDTVTAWANSPTHRANLLNSNYKEIGIAIAPAKIQGSEGFLVVQLFGTPTPLSPVKVTAIPPKKIIKARISPTMNPTPAMATIIASPVASPLPKITPEKPITSVISNSSPKLENIAHNFNAGFTLYSLIAFLSSLIILTFYGLKKERIIQTAASFAILVLALIIPVIQITHLAQII